MWRFFRTTWFFFGIAAMVGLAFLWPEVGDLFARYSLLKIAVFASFLITGATLETSSIINEIKNLRGISTAMLSSFVFFPLIAMPMAYLFFGQNRDFVVGIAILSVVPVTIASGIVLTAIASGNVPLSLFITVGTNLVSILTIPLSLDLLLRFGGQVELPIGGMIRELLLVVLVPTILGQLLRIKFSERIKSCRPCFSTFQQIIVLLIILNAVSSSTGKLGEFGLGVVPMFLFVCLLHTIALAMNLGLSRLIRLPLESQATFTIHTSQKTITISFIVWSGYFSGYAMAMIPAIVYHITQIVADTFVAHRFRNAIRRQHGE